ncbi:MAG: hypothetical protein A2508_10380 [Candidatus Lambdaproteobacteria bacterium RIFOXYD12_FULL_49_8]|uniref:VWFA domain-containing protein n=1 Tax=Candidatus Lambdaproteobacteria bacterium RIFOXYD2_FULL_50_16 TaxID=1817772 RepID=A0A1F6GB50_9PROT|nr:MAG: hypothetical protein A2527_07420 [Candidatus Lambdaproteobacteria bacterium RIFOXYD2_FULL_50_16]OGG97074.1 MAG: hypothetical protein A2508_10380 [Candidatus Lambdaproteobacteria bacterium RIFOXYD12_FULL_49_8]
MISGFSHPGWALGLGLWLGLGILGWLFFKKRPLKLKRRPAKTQLLWPLAALLLGLLALMRPQGDPQSVMAQKKGRDLVILLDLSKSMLAQDLRPNRLERAKGMISDLLGSLSGERVALIGFAGEVKLLVPLTLDYDYFSNTLAQTDPQSLHRGGTLLGEAIRVSLEMLFFDPSNHTRELLLITDGEDQESEPLEAAKEAAKLGVIVHTLGLGDPRGTLVPGAEKDGQPVLSRLDQKTLNEIARQTGGVYIPAELKRVDMAEIYRDFLSHPAEAQGQTKEAQVYTELFPWVLWPAALCLLWAVSPLQLGANRQS